MGYVIAVYYLLLNFLIFIYWADFYQYYYHLFLFIATINLDCVLFALKSGL